MHMFLANLISSPFSNLFNAMESPSPLQAYSDFCFKIPITDITSGKKRKKRSAQVGSVIVYCSDIVKCIVYCLFFSYCCGYCLCLGRARRRLLLPGEGPAPARPGHDEKVGGGWMTHGIVNQNANERNVEKPKVIRGVGGCASGLKK